MRTALFILGLVAATCCGRSLAQSPEPSRPVRERAQNLPSVPANYRHQPNDLIQIKVLQEDDLLTVTRIGKDNTIQFPMAGTVKLGGLSLPAAEEEIRRQLEEKQINRPQVSIALLEHAPQRFTILGEVLKPGSPELPPGQAVSLPEAIGHAGGYTPLANPASVTVKRQGRVFQIDARKMATQQNVKMFEIQPGDVITVGTNCRFTVLGQVQKPGTYECPPGQELTLLSAIGQAGGYTRIANPRKVTIKRKNEVFRLDARKMAEEKNVEVFQIQPGDVITVAESLF